MRMRPPWSVSHRDALGLPGPSTDDDKFQRRLGRSAQYCRQREVVICQTTELQQRTSIQLIFDTHMVDYIQYTNTDVYIHNDEKWGVNRRVRMRLIAPSRHLQTISYTRTNVLST